MNFNYEQTYPNVGAFIVWSGDLLLVEEGLWPDKGKLDLPSGKLDVGKGARYTVRREAHQEAGIDFTPTEMLSVHTVYRRTIPGPPPASPAQVARMIYTGEATDNKVTHEHCEVVDGDPEITGHRWIDLRTVLGMGDAAFRFHDIRPLVRKYLSKDPLPIDHLGHIIQDA